MTLSGFSFSLNGIGKATSYTRCQRVLDCHAFSSVPIWHGVVKYICTGRLVTWGRRGGWVKIRSMQRPVPLFGEFRVLEAVSVAICRAMRTTFCSALLACNLAGHLTVNGIIVVWFGFWGRSRRAKTASLTKQAAATVPSPSAIRGHGERELPERRGRAARKKIRSACVPQRSTGAGVIPCRVSHVQ